MNDMDMDGIEREVDNVILKRALHWRGMTQQDLAEKMGVIQPTISGNLNRKRMGLDVFRSILDVLDYDVVVVDRRNGRPIWIVDDEI